MIKKTYKAEFDPLDPKSVDKLVKYFDEQWVKKLDGFGERVAKRLADEGFEVAFGIISTHMMTGDTFTSLSVRHDEDGVYTIYADSRGLLFLEFGSGVVGQSGEQNPWAAEYGFGPGTYPGQTNALNPSGWVYPTGEKDEDGNDVLRRTKGQTAKRPFYSAFKAMEQHLEQIVNEEFDPDDFA